MANGGTGCQYPTTNLNNNQAVAIPVLEKICAELECNIGDIMEFANLNAVREERKKRR